MKAQETIFDREMSIGAIKIFPDNSLLSISAKRETVGYSLVISRATEEDEVRIC